MLTPSPERIMNLNLSYWALQTAAMVVTALLIPRLRITSIFGAIITVVAIALVNAHLWDAALFFKVPDSLSAQTLTLFFANGIIFWILVKLLPGIEVEGIFPALIAPIVFTFSSVLISKYAKEIDWNQVYKWLVTTLESVRQYISQSQPTPTKPSS